MEAKKSIKPLGQRQLFSMKRTSLEKKIRSYYEATNDVSSVVEYLVVVLLRDSLVLSDFSFMCKDLVRHLFMTAAPNDTLRHFCGYFKAFFTEEEWHKQVVERLFQNEAVYLKASRQARLYSKCLNTPGTGKCKYPDLRHDLIAIFEDASGRKHRLTIRDTHESITKEQAKQRLEILTTLSIFTTNNGVRRFVNYIDVGRRGVKETFPEEEQAAKDSQQEPVEAFDTQSTAEETIEISAPAGIDTDALSEEQLLKLVQVAHPEVRSLENIRVVFTEQESEEQTSMEEPPIIEELNEGEASVAVKTSVADPPAKAAETKRPQETHKGYVIGFVKNLFGKYP